MSPIQRLFDALKASQKAIRQLRTQGAPTALWSDIEAANQAAMAAARNTTEVGMKSITFHVGAAKSYQDEGTEHCCPNWKYLNSFPTLAEAQVDFDHYCASYPINEIYMMIVYGDDTCERIDVDTGRHHLLVDGKWVYQGVA